MKKKINIQHFDEKPLIFNQLPAHYYMICCDCGLSHLILIEPRGKGVLVGMERVEALTDLERSNRRLKKRQKCTK